MSERKHTPGPWMAEGQTVYALNDDGCNRFSALVQDTHTPGDELQANARRIVACVNACEGVHNNYLDAVAEEGGAVKFFKERQEFKDQRDALLAALERMLGKAYKQNWNDQYPAELEQAESAIAKAIGETK